MTTCFGENVEPTGSEEVHDDSRIQNEHRWVSCCFEVDKRVVLFFAQLSLAIYVVSFCMYQLTHLENCEAQSLYSGIMTFVIGIYLPNPKIYK